MVRVGSRQLELPWKPGGRSGTHCCQSKRLPSSDSRRLMAQALGLLLFAIALMRRASLSCWRSAGLVWCSSRSRAGAERRGRRQERGEQRKRKRSTAAGACSWGAGERAQGTVALCWNGSASRPEQPRLCTQHPHMAQGPHQHPQHSAPQVQAGVQPPKAPSRVGRGAPSSSVLPRASCPAKAAQSTP